MATYREIVYMVLEELKRDSDDSFFTEEHAAFLAERYRSLLLETKYAKDNSPVDDDDYSEICMEVAPYSPYGDGCPPIYLRTVESFPATVGVGCKRVYGADYMTSERMAFVPMERLRFAGESRWLRDFIYVAQDTDGHLVLKSGNPQLAHLKSVRVSAVFASPRGAAAMSCGGSDGECEWLDMEFPIEAGQEAVLVASVVKELSGQSYSPQDSGNNARDDLNDIGLYTAQQASRARASAYRSGNKKNASDYETE